jgi:hypothetical protein
VFYGDMASQSQWLELTRNGEQCFGSKMYRQTSRVGSLVVRLPMLSESFGLSFCNDRDGLCDAEGFYDPQGWCDERQVPLVLDGTQRQSSAKISLDAIKTGGSCVEVMIVNELRGAEGEFWLTLHCSSGELFVESLPAPAPTPQQAAAMARDVGRTDTDPTAVFKEEEEVGAELIAVLSQQQRCVARALDHHGLSWQMI